jgi:MoxR-like ATPase
MKLSQAYKTLELAHSINAATIMWGGPGLGKSSLAHQFAQDKKLAIIDWRLTLMDSVDMRGTPFRDKDGFTVWAPPAELPRKGSKPGILFLDELPQARMEVKNVAAMLVLEHRIGEWKLPKGWWMLAAGNRMGDAAGTSPMPTHLNNRFWHRRRSLSHDWPIGRERA